jgi:hypothetical protein
MDAPWTDAIYPWYDGGKEDLCKLSDPTKEHEAPRQCGFDDDVCVPVQEHAQREADHIDPLWFSLGVVTNYIRRKEQGYSEDRNTRKKPPYMRSTRMWYA